MEIIRSWLISPANRPDFLKKFPAIGADCSVMDLEDGTPEQHKPATREGLAASVAQMRSWGLRQGLYVRVNHPRSAHYRADLEAAGAAQVDGVGIPKLGSVAELRTAGA